MPFHTYPGPVLLLHGAGDSIYGNPSKNFRNPELAWRRAFTDYVVIEVPGKYARIFDDGTIDALSTTLAQHMRKAESLPPRLVPKLAREAEVTADNIPTSMVSGDRRNIAIHVRNAVCDNVGPRGKIPVCC